MNFLRQQKIRPLKKDELASSGVRKDEKDEKEIEEEIEVTSKDKSTYMELL